MSGKKKINIVLIGIVLALWGTVGYKTVNNYFFSKKLATKAMSYDNGLDTRQINKDTFHLESVMRDPFLNKQNYSSVSVTKISYPRSLSIKNKVVVAPVIKPKQEYINWPSISYHGYIKSKVNNDEVVLVKINQKMHKIKVNEEVEGVTLMKVYKDSIEFNFNNRKKIIQKKVTI